MMDEAQIKKLIDERLSQSFVKKIGDTPTDDLQLANKKYVDSKAVIHNQYSETADYTTNTVKVITTTFKPYQVLFNGYTYTPHSGYSNITLTTGFAGRTAPTIGRNNYMDLSQDPSTSVVSFAIGTGVNLGGDGGIYCYVSAWNDTGIELTVICPAGSTLSTNLMIT